MNNWNSGMDLTEKKNATHELIKLIPDLKNKIIIIMPSDSRNDIIELIRQNKIDKSTVFIIVDNLQSQGFKGKNKKEKGKWYKEETVKFLKKELHTDKINYKFLLDINIENICFSAVSYNDEYLTSDFIYADTCGTYKNDWFSKPVFLQALNKKGYFAYTVLLTRSNINGNDKTPASNPKVILLGEKSKELNHRKLNIIANDVEEKTNHILETKAMIYYYNNIKSPMGILLFQKKIDY